MIEGLNEYHVAAMKTYRRRPNPIIYPALKLNGEAGEVAEKVGKTLRDKGGTFDGETRRAIALELGDVLWYVSALADDLGFNLQTIAEMNILKLQDRAARGVLGGSGDNR